MSRQVETGWCPTDHSLTDRPVPSPSGAEDHHRSYRSGHPGDAVADRQPQSLSQGAQETRLPAADRRLYASQFLDHDIEHFPTAIADRRDTGTGFGTDIAFHRLAVRECGSCRELVRYGAGQRSGPRQDRACNAQLLFDLQGRGGFGFLRWRALTAPDNTRQEDHQADGKI